MKNLVLKCPQCRTVLFLKKPLIQPAKGLNRGKILIAHSDPAIVDNVASLLNENGYQTLTSFDGIAAIVQVIKESPLLVVIEGNLPKINGLEVYKRLKSGAKTKEVEFLFLVSVHDKMNGNPTCAFKKIQHVEFNRKPERLMEKIIEILETNKEKVV